MGEDGGGDDQEAGVGGVEPGRDVGLQLGHQRLAGRLGRLGGRRNWSKRGAETSSREPGLAGSSGPHLQVVGQGLEGLEGLGAGGADLVPDDAELALGQVRLVQEHVALDAGLGVGGLQRVGITGMKMAWFEEYFGTLNIQTVMFSLFSLV